METKKLLLIMGSVVAMFVLLYGAYYATSKPAQTFFENLTTLKTSDHTKWSPEKKILLYEFSDFQCPACKAYFEMVKSFESDPENKELVDAVTFVYRNFPLDQIHPNARDAAHAAEAAAIQNAFYPYHDLLFENQADWSETGDPYPLFEKYATDLKLDIAQFTEDYSSSAIKEKVQNDYLSGIEADVQGTPTFYLNGKKIRNPQSADELKTIIQDEIQALK